MAHKKGGGSTKNGRDSQAKRLGLHKNDEGLYDFPLGTIIRYDSSVDRYIGDVMCGGGGVFYRV